MNIMQGMNRRGLLINEVLFGIRGHAAHISTHRAASIRSIQPVDRTQDQKTQEPSLAFERARPPVQAHEVLHCSATPEVGSYPGHPFPSSTLPTQSECIG